MSQRKTTAFFLFAVLSRILFIVLFPPQGTDHEMLHTAVDNLLNGHGLGFTVASAQDFSSTQFLPFTDWPPLMAYIVSVAKAITGSKLAADLLLMSTGMLFLMLVVRALMQQLQLKPTVQILVWLAVATNPDPFRMLGLTDLYGALFLMWSILFCMRFIQQPYIRTAQLLTAAVFFFLPAAFRYQYYPIIFICPLFLLAAAKLTGNKHLFHRAGLALSVVFVLFAAQIMLLVQQAGNAAHIAADPVGFFPQHLLWMHPFLFKAFLNTSYLETTIYTNIKPAITHYFAAASVVTGGLVLLTGIHLFRKIREIGTAPEADRLTLRRSLLFIAALTNVALLAVLAVRYAPQIAPDNGTFTYVKEGRYFIVPSLCMLLLGTSILQQWIPLVWSNGRRLIRPVAAGLLAMNLLLFGKFIYNAATQQLPQPFAASIKEREIVKQQIEELQQQYGLPVVAIPADRYFAYQPIFSSYRILRHYSSLQNGQYNSSQPVQVVIIDSAVPSANTLSLVQRTGAVQRYAGKKYRIYHFITGTQRQIAAL